MNGRDARPDAGAGSPGAGSPTPPREHEPPPPGAGFMNALRWGLFAGLLALAAISLASYVAWRMASGKPAAGAQTKQARYHCPMHPSYTSDRPGECPICGMSLEPIPADSHAGHVAAGETGDVPGLAAVHLTPDRIQLIGVRYAQAERRPMGGELDLVGFVAPDESRLKRVQLRSAGWVQELAVSRTGEDVRAGDPLLTMYSPELYQSEREFLIETEPRARTSSAHTGASRDSAHGAPQASDAVPDPHGLGDPATVAAARERLRLLGVPDAEVARLERERTASTRVTLRSPVTGTVLERGVTEGQYVAPDTPLFTVADLSRVWVLADLYEMDFGRAHVGDRAVLTTDALPARPFDARVEFVYPTVTNDTRTLKVRLSIDNPDRSLRPGMYGRVRLLGRGQPALTVPVEAVVNAGEHDYVFLAREGGHFEPRMVWTGLQAGDRVQILRGLSEGDTVVASASFLIDSESRLKAAIAGVGKQPAAAHQH